MNSLIKMDIVNNIKENLFAGFWQLCYSRFYECGN